jgi:hypothetical protein
MLKPFTPEQCWVECYTPRKRGGQILDCGSEIVIDVWGEFKYDIIFDGSSCTDYFSYRLNAEVFELASGGAEMLLKVIRNWYPYPPAPDIEF